jgi:hypothetical protein
MSSAVIITTLGRSGGRTRGFGAGRPSTLPVLLIAGSPVGDGGTRCGTVKLV